MRILIIFSFYFLLIIQKQHKLKQKKQWICKTNLLRIHLKPSILTYIGMKSLLFLTSQKLFIWFNDNSNKIYINSMSENPYPDLVNQPLLANNRAPPPPPPPRAVNNPSFNAPNPSFNAPNPSFNNPNPSFNNPNQVFVHNPNPSFNNANPVYVNNPNNPPYLNNNPYPNNNPYNQNYPNQVGSVGNYQVIRNNGPYVQNYGVNVNCLLCRRETSSITRKTPGGVTWIWCFVLFVVTGICCCIPFCVDSCQDTEIVCVNCQTVKSRIQANCC